MPIFFQRPENALKRANEFIDVGKKARALDALYDVIKSKKHRTWQKIHEPIMEKYLELCVELKKSHIAKEGLYQYKNICQQVNIKSLEDVVRKYLHMAEKKTEEARAESHQAVVDIDDLDVIASPEDLLLSAVSGEDTQDRTDRAILTPWVKFLWESYRQCLDLLRNNNSVERLYQDIAQQAFKFCLKYERKTEFRKLCDNLRTHLSHIHKHQHQHRAINLEDPESQAMHLETRLVQLNSAIQMELWQEAFKAVEDIHGLITKPKKQPKPSLMANYYNKLGLVFWKSGNKLFHACAFHRLFHLSLEQRRNLSQNELAKMSSRVLCATLAIPIPASRNAIDQLVEQDENAVEKQRRLATLLGLTSPPTRAQLIKDLFKYNIVNHVYPEVKNLYQWLEVDFHPLKLSKRVEGSLDFIRNNDQLSQYASAIEEITVTRLIKQVSQVYQTIEFAKLLKLAPIDDSTRLERMVVNSARNLELQIRIDHRSRSLSFGTDLGVAQKEDVPEGPYLQCMPSEHIRNQLTFMAASLDKAMKLIKPHNVSVERDELRQMIMQKYRSVAKNEHIRILQRRQIIEERKEELENINTQREQKEMEILEDQRRRQYEAEMARLEKEAEERERQRRINEHTEIKKKAARERLDQLKSTEIGVRAFADLKEEEIADMDVDDILAKQVEQLEKEKRELAEKLKSQEKKVDYFERAKRLEEIPLLKEEYEKWQVKDREFWNVQEEEKVKTLEAERAIALTHRDRLRRMIPDKDEFINRLQQDRVSVYQEKLAKFEATLSVERTKRMAERKERRKSDRRTAWFKAKQEEEQRKRDEELKREREEEERKQIEKREAEEAEYQEKLRKLEEIEERKRQREREIEEKRKTEEAERRERERDSDRDGRRDDRGGGGRDEWRRGGERQTDSHSPDKGGSWRPSGGAPSSETGGGWRDRVKEKEDRWKASDDREEPRSDAWRRGGDDRGAPRRGDDDRAPARRSDDRDEWRRGGDRDEPRRGGDDQGAWRRGADRDDRAPLARRDDDRWKRDDRAPARDAPRDEGRWGRDDRGPADRGGSRDGWRSGGARDDRDRGGDTWRRGGDDKPRDDGGRWGRDDRSGAGRDDRGGGGRDGGSAWGRPRSDREGAADSRGGDDWRRGGGRDREDDRKAPPPRDDRRGDPPPKKPETEGSDGAWTTVKRP